MSDQALLAKDVDGDVAVPASARPPAGCLRWVWFAGARTESDRLALERMLGA